MELWFEYLIHLIQAAANMTVAGASGIAIYIFFFKRKAVSSVFNALLNYSYQITLSELERKLDDLNKLNFDVGNDKSEILNILGDIMGQLEGNSSLEKTFQDIIIKIDRVLKNPSSFRETSKRSLVSNIREKLRSVKVQNIDSLVGGV